MTTLNGTEVTVLGTVLPALGVLWHRLGPIVAAKAVRIAPVVHTVVKDAEAVTDAILTPSERLKLVQEFAHGLDVTVPVASASGAAQVASVPVPPR